MSLIGTSSSARGPLSALFQVWRSLVLALFAADSSVRGSSGHGTTASLSSLPGAGRGCVAMRARSVGCFLLRPPPAGPTATNACCSVSQASARPRVPRCRPSAVRVSQGCSPRLMRARACLPDGFGAPAHLAPRPYALRAEKAPHRTQKSTCAGGGVAARIWPLSTIASAAREALGPAQGSHAMACVISALVDILRHVLHLQKPAENIQS